MIGIFELLLILAGAGIIGSTFWIWRYKTDWSTQKKVVIAILLAIGLIAAAFTSSLAFWLQEAGHGIGIVEVSKPTNKFEYTEITEVKSEEYPALKEAISVTGFLSG
ncbi:MAG: hypothetical protein ABOK23_00345 [Candidatus Methanoperedens sp.]|nr:hypothetical protein [Candidatus Methanoperedens sp.]MCZ7395782.1 hypothetical protein [Candidatus Methanoperedens sp.]